jgi:hypothetical protein
MFTLQGNRTIGYLVSILRVNAIGLSLQLSFLLCLLISVPAYSQDQPTDTSFPPLTSYQHKDLRFRIPEGWKVTVKEDSEASQIISVVENPDEPDTSPGLTWFKLSAVKKEVTPQNIVENIIRKILAQPDYENFNIEKEQLKSADYYAVLFTFTHKEVPGKGVFYSYFDDQGALVILHFSAMQSQFDALGGAALPFVTFDNADPSQIKLSGEFQTTVEAFPISFREVVSSSTAKPNPFPVLGLATDLNIRAPLHWIVSSNLLTGEIKLSENPKDPAAPLVVYKTFKLSELLTPSQLTQNVNATTALMQGLATLNIQAVRQQEDHSIDSIDGNNQHIFLANANRAGVPSKLTAVYDLDQQKQTFSLTVFVAPTARYTELGGAMLIGVTVGKFDPAAHAQATFNSLRPGADVSDAALLTKILEHNIMLAQARARKRRDEERLMVQLRLAQIQAEANMFTMYTNTIMDINDNIANSVEPVDYYYDYSVDDYVPCSPSGTTFGSC